MTDECPRCGAPVALEEQDSSSGTMWRTYACTRCNWFEDVNEGTATWKLLHDHNEAREAEEARNGQGEAQPAPPVPRRPLVQRLKRWAWRIWAAVVLTMLAIYVYILFGIVR